MTASAAPAPALENPAQTPHVDRGVALKSIFALWTFYYVLNTVRMAIQWEHDQLGMMVRRFGVVAVGIVLTYGMYLVLRRFEARSMRFMVVLAFLVSIPAAILYAATNFTAFYLVAPAPSLLQELSEFHAKPYGTLSVISESAVSWYFFMVSWGVLYVALSYAAKVGQAERNAAVYRSQAQAAQLRALRYQINPHFLFNTLNSLSALVLTQRTADAESMITNLATFFRSSLTSDPAADVTLSDEIDMQRLYLDIERIRFPERLSVVIDVPQELENTLVPGMILQPLVENSIRHGVARSSKPVTLAIRARKEGRSVHLTVEDDAQGTGDSGRIGGVGLKNVCDRLAARYDGTAECHYGPRDSGGFRVSLTMPWIPDA